MMCRNFRRTSIRDGQLFVEATIGGRSIRVRIDPVVQIATFEDIAQPPIEDQESNALLALFSMNDRALSRVRNCMALRCDAFSYRSRTGPRCAETSSPCCSTEAYLNADWQCPRELWMD